MRPWNILKNSRIKIFRMPLVNRMTLLVQVPHDEELKELSLYFKA
jgi:hypothetical protein